MGLVLKLEVLRGRGLAAKDKSGTSDPYLVVTLGEGKEATPVINKTLDPEWNETFELPILNAESALLEAVCWDKDRFKKDYMGEFDVLLEDVFASGNISPEPQWFKLESRRSGRRRKKDVVVTGEVLLKFTLVDPVNTGVTPEQIMQKFTGVVEDTSSEDDEDDEDEDDDDELLSRMDTRELDDLNEEDDERDPSDETDDAKTSPNNKEDKQHRRRRRRLRRLRRRSKLKAYEFSGTSDVAGVLFLEINKITDLPPEKNMTRTSFDMDPFVVTSLGRKTYRTRVVRHDLNPVFDEKLVFQVQKHQLNFLLNFAVVDRDKLSGNDFVGTCNLPVPKITEMAPQPDPMTGLYELPSPPDPTEDSGSTDVQRRRRFRIPLSRSGSQSNVGRSSRNSSSSNLARMARTTSSNSVQKSPMPSIRLEEASGSAIEDDDRSAPTSNPEMNTSTTSLNVAEPPTAGDDPELNAFEMPLELKNKQKWDNKCNPTIYIKAKYLPYQALRQQFWRAMLRQYDADESGMMNKVELTTMLDSLGSTLHAKTIDGFFKHWKDDNGGREKLTMDQAVISLEDQLMKTTGQHQPGWSLAGLKARMDPRTTTSRLETVGDDSADDSSGGNTPCLSGRDGLPSNMNSGSAPIPVLAISDMSEKGEQGDALPENDLAGTDSVATDDEDDLEEDPDTREEHVVEIQECPICHQPRLARRKRTNDADIITHIATCASSDWRSVNDIVMAGFVTSSQAQRKWYSKIITKVGVKHNQYSTGMTNVSVRSLMVGTSSVPIAPTFWFRIASLG